GAILRALDADLWFGGFSSCRFLLPLLHETPAVLYSGPRWFQRLPARDCTVPDRKPWSPRGAIALAILRSRDNCVVAAGRDLSAPDVAQATRRILPHLRSSFLPW